MPMLVFVKSVIKQRWGARVFGQVNTQRKVKWGNKISAEEIHLK